jgi:hypothetical protein
MYYRGKDRDEDRVETNGPKSKQEWLKILVELGVPLTGLAVLLTGAFSSQTKSEIRGRARGVSELSGESVRGLPHHCCHTDHDTHDPNYDDPYNGVYATIWEHRQLHIDSQRRGTIEGTSKLDNGLTIPGNMASIELLSISISVFEAILQEREEDIDALQEEYAQGKKLDSALTPQRAMRAIFEEKEYFASQYQHLAYPVRRELQLKANIHADRVQHPRSREKTVLTHTSREDRRIR